MESFVGARILQVRDETNGFAFPVLVMYPGPAPSSPVSFGPYSLDVAMDAPINEGSFPLVIISHGSGTTPYAYRTIASYLVKHGDGRVKALVLMAPVSAGGLPARRGAADIRADGRARPLYAQCPGGGHLGGISEPSRIDHRVIENAGHFSFLSPFPPEMKNQTSGHPSTRKDSNGKHFMRSSIGICLLISMKTCAMLHGRKIRSLEW